MVMGHIYVCGKKSDGFVLDWGDTSSWARILYSTFGLREALCLAGRMQTSSSPFSFGMPGRQELGKVAASVMAASVIYLDEPCTHAIERLCMPHAGAATPRRIRDSIT